MDRAAGGLKSEAADNLRRHRRRHHQRQRKQRMNIIDTPENPSPFTSRTSMHLPDGKDAKRSTVKGISNSNSNAAILDKSDNDGEDNLRRHRHHQRKQRMNIIDTPENPSPFTSRMSMHLPDGKDAKSSTVKGISNSNAAILDESDNDREESDISGSDMDGSSWISRFCNLRGNEFLCKVEDDYIRDDFNLFSLSSQIPCYNYALDLILNVENGEVFSEDLNKLVELGAKTLYGVIHARYILTSKGMAAMLEKYKNIDFGRCPRVNCCGQPCLPVGQSDYARFNTVKVYCPRCEDIYFPRTKNQDNIDGFPCQKKDIDGAYFGTTFSHLFMMTYPHLKPQSAMQNYIPRVFGFKIHKT